MRQKGVMHIAAIIIVGVVVILIAAAGAYYSLLAKKNASNVAPTTAPISENDDTSTIEDEINATNESSIEADLEQLDSSASSL